MMRRDYTKTPRNNLSRAAGSAVVLPEALDLGEDRQERQKQRKTPEELEFSEFFRRLWGSAGALAVLLSSLMAELQEACAARSGARPRGGQDQQYVVGRALSSG